MSYTTKLLKTIIFTKICLEKRYVLKFKIKLCVSL